MWFILGSQFEGNEVGPFETKQAAKTFSLENDFECCKFCFRQMKQK